VPGGAAGDRVDPVMQRLRRRGQPLRLPVLHRALDRRQLLLPHGQLHGGLRDGPVRLRLFHQLRRHLPDGQRPAAQRLAERALAVGRQHGRPQVLTASAGLELLALAVEQELPVQAAQTDLEGADGVDAAGKFGGGGTQGPDGAYVDKPLASHLEGTVKLEAEFGGECHSSGRAPPIVTVGARPADYFVFTGSAGRAGRRRGEVCRVFCSSLTARSSCGSRPSSNDLASFSTTMSGSTPWPSMV